MNSKKILEHVSNNQKKHKMNCSEIRNRISMLVWEKASDAPGREMSPDRELSAHLQECASCALFYKNYQSGVQSILADKRTQPDPDLYSKLEQRIQSDDQALLFGSTTHTGVMPGKRQIFPYQHQPAWQDNRRIITRLAWSITAGAAAVMAGIWTGNQFAVDTYLNSDKQLYQQEISMQSDDLSGLNDGLIDYFNYEKPLNDE